MAFWNTKAAPVRSPTEAPVQPKLVYLSSGTAVAIVNWSESYTAEAAMKHPITFRALDKLASSVQQVRWFVETDPYATGEERSGKQAIIKNLQGLLDSPNADMSPAMLRYWLTLNYAAFGRVPLKIGFSAVVKTQANGIYPLEVGQVQALINERGAVTSYEYGTGERKQVIPGRANWKPGDKQGFVDQIWKPTLRGFQHPQDANSPLKAVGLPAQVVKMLMQRAIKSAEGHPNCRYLVVASRSLTAAQMTTLREHLENAEESDNSGRIPVLQNAGDLVIHKLDNDLSDIHSKMPSDDMARLIFGAFGIPIALAGMGAADGAKFAGNFIESRLAFWQDTIIPCYIEPLFQGLTRMLCPPGVRISADLDSVPALMSGRILSMKDVDAVKFLTNDEKREMFGWSKSTTGDNNV